jgi:hypothetical protein
MPTTSPVWNVLIDNNGCPEAYIGGTDYEPNDMVSVAIDDIGSVVYQCSSDVHLARFCKQYEPGSAYGMGWTLVAHCRGTMSPTASPNFQVLREIGEGCPQEYSTSNKYEPGDEVTVSLSEFPDRKVVFECRAWPDGLFCNSGYAYAPDSKYSSIGWILKGYCDGTISPTSSPVLYPDSECTWLNGAKLVVISPWSDSSLSTYEEGTRVRKHNRI